MVKGRWVDAFDAMQEEVCSLCNGYEWAVFRGGVTFE